MIPALNLRTRMIRKTKVSSIFDIFVEKRRWNQSREKMLEKKGDTQINYSRPIRRLIFPPNFHDDKTAR